MQEEQNNQVVDQPKSRNPLPWILFVIALIMAGGASYYAYTLNQRNTALQADKAELEASTKTTTVTAVSTNSDAQKVAQAFIGGGGYNWKVTKTEGDFISYSYFYTDGSDPSIGGGAMVVLKKVNGIWIPIYHGNESPTKAMGAEFKMPTGWYATDY